MRIGIDARLWNESGVGRYVRNLVEQLQLIDHENKYVLFVGSKDYENVKCQMSNVKWRLVKADIGWHTLEEQLKFPLIINKENLDLMHFPYFSVPIFYNRPYIVTIHDLILHHFPTGLASTLPRYLYRLKLLGYKFVIKKAAQNAKKIITVSNATRDEIIDHLKIEPSKVVVTYEGIDNKISNIKYQMSKTPASRKLQRGEQIKNQKYFLYVGNVYPHKNLERMLSAFENVKCQMSNVKLVLVGKEDYFYKRLKEKVKKVNLEKSVLFYGEVSDEELVELYKNAKALIVPSLMEGFGLPGLEAMANKCLVLSSDIPSLREVYGNAAVYFNPNDVLDMEKKMIEVLGSKVGHDFVGHGLERTKMFSWEKMAKETLRIYESHR